MTFEHPHVAGHDISAEKIEEVKNFANEIINSQRENHEKIKLLTEQVNFLMHAAENDDNEADVRQHAYDESERLHAEVTRLERLN